MGCFLSGGGTIPIELEVEPSNFIKIQSKWRGGCPLRGLHPACLKKNFVVEEGWLSGLKRTPGERVVVERRLSGSNPDLSVLLRS